MIDPLRDGSGWACKSCVPDGQPDDMCVKFMAMFPGKCQACPWQGTLAEQGRHVRIECELRTVPCDACGQEITAQQREAHLTECPSVLVDYSCCNKRGRRCDTLTHTVDCVFGCGPFKCMDRVKHDYDAYAEHREQHMALKGQLSTLKRNFIALTESYDAMKDKRPRREPEAPRRRKNVGEMPVHFSVNMPLPDMVTYLNQGGSGTRGHDILRKINEIFQHPKYSKKITSSMVDDLMDAVHALIVDVYCIDEPSKWEINMKTGLDLVQTCVKFTGHLMQKALPFSEKVLPFLEDVLNHMPQESMYAIRVEYFNLLRSLPVNLQKQFCATLVLLPEKHPQVAATGEYFQALVVCRNRIAKSTEGFQRIATAIKKSAYKKNYGFLHLLVESDTVDVCYKTGLIDYIAAQLPGHFHARALETLHKISGFNPSRLDRVRALLPANF